jgi:hypothetical protein
MDPNADGLVSELSVCMLVCECAGEAGGTVCAFFSLPAGASPSMFACLVFDAFAGFACLVLHCYYCRSIWSAY